MTKWDKLIIYLNGHHRRGNMQEHNTMGTEDESQESLRSLQPLNLTDILDGMFSLYRNNFQLFLTIVLVYFAIGYVIDKIGTYLILRSTFDNILLGLFFTIGTSTILVIFVMGAILYASSQIYLGKSITAEAALQQSLRRYLPFLGGFVLYILVITGLSITCIGVPFAIYLTFRWGLYSLPILVEERSVGASLRRSSELVKGNWWRVCGIMLAIILIYYMISSILSTTFSSIFMLIPGTGEMPPDATLMEMFVFYFAPTPEEIGWFMYFIRSFFTLAIAALLMPIASIGTMLLYFDMRIRKEALDLEMQVTENIEQIPAQQNQIPTQQNEES